MGMMQEIRIECKIETTKGETRDVSRTKEINAKYSKKRIYQIFRSDIYIENSDIKRIVSLNIIEEAEIYGNNNINLTPKAMDIQEAVKIIGKKAVIMKHGADEALISNDGMIKFVSMMLEQYYETEGNKSLMNKTFGKDVMDCLVQYAAQVNAIADVLLMEAQAKEEHEYTKEGRIWRRIKK